MANLPIPMDMVRILRHTTPTLPTTMARGITIQGIMKDSLEEIEALFFSSMDTIY
jgi:hypothetical protein